MGRLLVALGVVLLCTCLVAPAGAGDPAPRLSTDAQEFDHVEFRITVDDDGSARWTFQYGRTLENDSEAAKFREFAAAFENGTPPLYEEFRSQARGLTDRGRNATGRNMTARNFRKRANVTGLGDSLGVVEMSFTWTGFAVVDGGQVRVGDVFEGGLYLAPDQRLVVEAGDGLAFESVDPSPDDVGGSTLPASDSVTWNGERRFTDNHPRVVLAPEDPATATTAPGPGTATTATPTATDPPATTGGGGTDPGADTTGAGPGDVMSTVPWLAVTAFAAAIVVGAVVVLQQVGIIFTGDGTGGSPASQGPDGDSPGPGGASPGPAGEGGGPAVEGEPAIPDEEMLTDEERVLSMLRENGGRMRQVNIVEGTDWSKSKVSMLLSEMEEEGQVTKLRVGRENIVSLPGHEPDASDSALE